MEMVGMMEMVAACVFGIACEEELPGVFSLPLLCVGSPVRSVTGRIGPREIGS
jgi:hypothetical protein